MLKQSWALFILCGLVALLALRGMPGAFTAAVAGLATLGVIRATGERSLSGISYERAASETHLFWGEEVRLDLSLRNARRWPAAWVTVREQLSRGLEPCEGAAAAGAPASYELTWTLPVDAGTRATYSRRFRCLRRGLQHIGTTQLESGDPLGLIRRQTTRTDRLSLVVYPRLLPLVDRALPTRRPGGERATRGWLFPDYSLYAGVRPYQSGDQRRQIHWRASARAGDLQTKIFQPALGDQLALCVNVDTLPRVWMGQREDALETVLMTAAAIAREATERHQRVSLALNGASPGVRGGATVPPGGGYDHLRVMLEALATVTSPGVCPLSALLSRADTLPAGATVVVISACTDEETMWRLAELQRRGRAVCLIEVGDEHQTAVAPTVPRQRVGEEARWRERSEISLL